MTWDEALALVRRMRREGYKEARVRREQWNRCLAVGTLRGRDVAFRSEAEYDSFMATEAETRRNLVAIGWVAA